MLQEATVTEIKSVSAVKPKREGGHARAKKRFRGHNVMWKRVTAAFDDDLRRLGANPAMVAPLSRWVMFNHLTKTQGAAGRYYAGIMRVFQRYHVEPKSRTPRSANLEPVRAEDQELERRINNCTIADYEADARHAKRQYDKLMKALAPFADPVTGRNVAKDLLDTLCLAEQETPAHVRPEIAAVLTHIAKTFKLGDFRNEEKAN